MDPFSLSHRVDTLLQAHLREEYEDTPIEPFDHLASEVGWPAVCDLLIAILEDKNQPVEHWGAVSEIFWGAVLAHRPVPADRLIALLYARLPPDPQSTENNLAWSIVTNLRGISYLSDYDPLADPRVLAELATISPTPAAPGGLEK